MQLTSNSPNQFLASLAANDRELIAPHLKPLPLPRGTVFYKAEGAIERVYFPNSGIVSLIVGLTSGQFVEAGVPGRNGVIGAGAALDGEIAFNADAFVIADEQGQSLTFVPVVDVLPKRLRDRRR